MTPSAPITGVIEAAGAARLHDYLRRAPDRTDAEELVARDGFMSGFQYGARWAVRMTAALSEPRFREALQIVAEALSE